MTDYEELAKMYGGSVAPSVGQQPAQQLTTSDAEVLAGQYGGKVAEPESLGLGQMLLQAGSNAPRSLYNLGKDVVTAVANPIDTLASLTELTMGAFQNLTPLDLEKSFGASPEEVKRTRSMANAVGEFYKDRYGSIEGAKQAFAQDPAGVLADASTVFGVGAAAIPAKFAKTTSALKTAATITDPAYLALKGTKTAANFGANRAADVLGLMTGAGSSPIKEAAKAGLTGGEKAKSFRQNIQGSVEMTDALDAAKANLAKMQADKQAMYRSNMQVIKNDATVLKFDDVDAALRDAQNMVSYKGQVKNEAAAAKLAEAQMRINDWRALDPKEFHTPEGMDALKQSIGDILESIPFEQKAARSAVGDVYAKIKNTISKQAPTYEKVMRAYAAASENIREIERALSLGKKASVDTAMRKLQSLMRDNVNTNYGQRGRLAKQLEEAGGKDFMPALAGQALQSVTPRGIQQGVSSLTGLGAFSVGGLPAALVTAAASSPRLAGEGAYLSGLLARYPARAAEMIKKNQPEADYQLLGNLLYQSQQPKGLLE